MSTLTSKDLIEASMKGCEKALKPNGKRLDCLDRLKQQRADKNSDRKSKRHMSQRLSLAAIEKNWNPQIAA